ncbi:MAG: helix-turn-helix domain-containing protein [Candidatus Paceibacterota bacterium]|jgi:hypothetical protein
MAKKVQKSATKPANKPFDVDPTEYMVVTIDVDFCDELAKFIKKKRGSGMIAEFGENLQSQVMAHRSGVSINLSTIEKEVEKYTAKADKFVKQVDKQAKVVAAKAAKAEKVKRERLAKKAKQLHAKGKSFRAIGKALGVSAITAARYCKK